MNMAATSDSRIVFWRIFSGKKSAANSVSGATGRRVWDSGWTCKHILPENGEVSLSEREREREMWTTGCCSCCLRRRHWRQRCGNVELSPATVNASFICTHRKSSCYNDSICCSVAAVYAGELSTHPTGACSPPKTFRHPSNIDPLLGIEC